MLRDRDLRSGMSGVRDKSAVTEGDGSQVCPGMLAVCCWSGGAGRFWWVCVEWFGEPHVVIKFNVEGFEEWVGDGGVGVVHVSEVGPIQWFNWSNGGW